MKVILFDRGVVHFLRKDYGKSIQDLAKLTRVQEKKVNHRSTLKILKRCESNLRARGLTRRGISPYDFIIEKEKTAAENRARRAELAIEKEKTAAENKARRAEWAEERAKRGFWGKLFFG